MAIVSFKRITGSPNIRTYPEASGTVLDFYEGDVVKFDSSGRIVIATIGAFAGITQKRATGTQGTAIPIDLIRPGDEFSVPFRAATTTIGLVNDVADVVLSKGAMTVQENNLSGTDTVIVGFDEGAGPGGLGVSGGRVKVIFDPDAIQGYRASK